MANTNKPAWPQTPDGTTDWEVVFEDADTGFIQLVAQSPNVETLRQTTTVVIDKLFTRRGDETEVQRLKAQLETILAAGSATDMAHKQAGVSGLLRQIKDARIEKARVYIERKRAGAAIDRRAGLLWKIDFLLKPKVLIPVGVLFIALISGSVFAILQTTLGPSRPAQVAEAPAEAPPPKTTEKPVEPEAKPEPEPEPKPVAKPKPAPKPTAEEPEEPKPVVIWLKTLRWPLSSMSASERPQYYAALLYVDNWDDKITACSRVANVMDRLYQILNRVLPHDSKATDAQLAEMERIAPNILNQIYKFNLIKNVEIVRYGDPRYKVAIRPPYCKSPDKN